MSNIKKAFEHGKAFIPFITCGDPTLDITREIVLSMVEAGADLVELGIPFSDPTAEGPVIQDGNMRALSKGITTDNIFEFVANLRKEVTVPLVFMTYANVVFSYGMEKFFSNCKKVGIDGIILPDVPFEEKSEFSEVCDKYGVDFISMIAPTSDDRIEMIAREAKGFVYCVSSLGVTGTRSEITTDVGAMVKKVKAVKDIPCAIGFGISTPEQAASLVKVSDGAIVGSAIVRMVEQYKEDSPKYVREFVKSIKDAYNAS